MSNKIIQKGLAFRFEPSGTVTAREAMTRLWDPAPPASSPRRGVGGAAP